MPGTEFPEIAERVETRICCAYNVATGSSINTRVGVADLALQPLRALKMLMDGLALDGVSSLWLRTLPGPPLMMRLFPFDFVYLDEELRVVEGVELAPDVAFPDYKMDVASALILPLRTLARTGTKKGDQLIICAPEELDLRLADIAMRHNVAADSEDTGPVTGSVEAEAAEISQIPQIPDAAPAARQPLDERFPMGISTVSPGAGFTVSLATAWQLSSSTTTAAVLPEAEEEIAAEKGVAIVEAPAAEIVAEDTVAIVEAPAAEIVAEETAAIVEAPADEVVTAETAAIVEAPADEIVAEEAVAIVEAPAEPESAVESTSEQAKPDGPVEVSTIEKPALAIELVPAAEPAETPAPEPGAEPQLALTFDQLCQAVAAAEAVATEEMAPAGPALPSEDERIARSKEAWEKTTVKTTHVDTTNPAEPQKKPRDPKKDPLGTRVIRWLNLEDPLPERRKIIRLLLEGLQAYDVDGDHAMRHDLRDVCPTGFCLRTQEKWKPGQLVSLMVERKGTNGKDPGHRVRVQARVVRCDEDGAGMEFVFSKGTEFKPWERVNTKRSDETEADFILRELRLSSALGFLRQLSPGADEQVRNTLHDRLSNKRVAGAVEITLMAEDALLRGGQVELACAHPDIVMHILDGGSWIDEEWIRRLWAGLLVSSCTADGKDTSNQLFIDLLAKLTPLHLRILSFTCGKALEAIAAGRPAKEFHIDCSAEELMEVADSHSFARIQQTVGHLATYGLFAEIKRPSYLTVTEKSKTKLAPTAMGLKMWARCNGQRA